MLEPAFPFVGAGDAAYLDSVEVHVVFSRAPTPKQRSAIKKLVPAPLRDVIAFENQHLMVASDQFAHVLIAQTYPAKHRRRDAHGRRFFAQPSQVTQFNDAIEHWLGLAHTTCPILIAFRPEDLNGGTPPSRWHAWSVRRVVDIVSALDLDQVGDRIAHVLRGALEMAAAARIKLPRSLHEFLAPETKFARALANGKNLETVVAGASEDGLRALLDVIDISNRKHRAALAGASKELLKRVDDDVELLVPLAVAVAVLDHPTQPKVLTAVRAHARSIGGDVHREAWKLCQAKRYGAAIVLFETLLAADDVDERERVAYNALWLVVAPSGELRFPAPRVRKLLRRCLVDASPRVHYNAACVHVALGDRAAALAAVERAVAGGHDKKVIAGDPQLASLHADARWIAAMRPAARKARRRT